MKTNATWRWILITVELLVISYITTALSHSMILRSTIIFLGLVGLQVLTVQFAYGRFAWRIYRPFIHFMVSFFKKNGASGERLWRARAWGIKLGIFVYSAVLALLGAYFTV
jgi:hypothetical protein